MSATCFALALAAALLDVTLGYPARLQVAIGSPSRWLALWLIIVESATAGWGGRLAMAIYLAPALVVAAAADVFLPSDVLGLALRALLVSTLSARQSLDRRGRETARVWECDGPGEAWVACEALSSQEEETRLAPAAAAAMAARFADEVVAPTLFVVIGGVTGAALCRALAVAARARRRNGGLSHTIATLAAWMLTPASRLAALWLAVASFRRATFSAVTAKASRPTFPAEAAMLAALGVARRDQPDYLRDALALYRRAAALELAALAVATLGAALLI